MNDKQSPLGYILLIYITFIISIITLLPFRFHWPETIEIAFLWSWFDSVMNVILFVPLGFLFRLAQRKEVGKERMWALAFGLLVSSCIEIAQIFQIDRYSSPLDLLVNGIGTWVGILFCDYCKRSLNQQIVRKFYLEIPLMNLFYLLGPLLWLNCISTGSDPSHLYLTPILGLLGASLLVSIWAYQPELRRTISANILVIVTGIWFFCASMPGLIINPLFILFSGIGIAIFSRIFVHISRFTLSSDRRFELAILKWICPIYVSYMFLLAYWPWIFPAHSCKCCISFDIASDDKLRIIPLLRILEYVSAFTILGYMVAEYRGRKKEPLYYTMTWVFICCLACSCLFELAKGFHPEQSASLVQFIVSIIVGLYGGVIYRLQLSAILRFTNKEKDMSTHEAH